MSVFHTVERVPVHSVLLMRTRAQALNYPTGSIHLALCDNCGFISNIAFDPSLHEYSQEYEATQSYSPTFNQFNRDLAQRLIDTFDLHEKTVIEIGCGHGEFLILLCEMGPNRGIGFDPAYIDERIDHPVKKQIQFVQDFYSERYADVHGDFLVCKMTLEHIADTSGFLETVRRSIGERTDTRLFFQIPNASYVLRDVAFWDIYYEHCSYFTKASLAALFIQSGFKVLDLFTGYDDQYLMIEASPATRAGAPLQSADEMLETVQADVRYFTAHIQVRLQAWREMLDFQVRNEQKTVLWGSGSKGVTFLNTLNVRDEITYVVDINPNKHGTFMAGTGQQIIGPEFLQAYQPDVVIVMNPIYEKEVAAALDDLGIAVQLLTVDSPQVYAE